MESSWFSRLWRRLIPIRFYASAAGGWYLHVNKRGFHITEVDFANIWKPQICQCEACRRDGHQHASSCAVHNGPALPPAACNCGAEPFPNSAHLGG